MAPSYPLTSQTCSSMFENLAPLFPAPECFHTLSYDQIKSSVVKLLEEDCEDDARELMKSFSDFDSFYNWLDTVTAYDQMDNDETVEHCKPLIEVIYNDIRAEYLGN